ncbi:MAG: single-stranded-DNA-specific exonuclease RecJ [Thermoleophilia bacterium]|nr:single-stranded-DNA-specific exonuclease RecJ [Thermoleophilia bacterium]
MAWTIAPCSTRAAGELAGALGISETTARVLVRRGLADPAAARAFLGAELPRHDPFLLGGVEAACAAIRATIAAGRSICVYGDYDVDGICATALAVLLLRELGADARWHLPSRFEEGYGLSVHALDRLADEGCGLVLTVDCGITAVEEVAAGRARGLEIVVTDHHRPGERLPDCPVVATRPSDYPFSELCGTGVVLKLGEALLGAHHPALARHLDLVALATIADVVPLVDENRALARAGLHALARTEKPGLKALMRLARVDPATLDEGGVGFRLAPRINAAGRLCRPEAALELLLADDAERAGQLAERLEELNRERQIVEDRILREAVAAIEEWPEPARRRRAYVVAGEHWHEGVIGIVASRLVERYHRPVVLIAAAEPFWKGSGRSIGAFDLHAALAACARHLERWGGHRAAAGLSIRPEHVERFTRDFAAHADSALTPADLEPRTVVDAVVRGRELTPRLCEELKQLRPFGLGNPAPTLLAAGCELTDATTTADGRHLRFRVRHDGVAAGTAIGFNLAPRCDWVRRPTRYDVVFRLEENHWNGTVAPQLVVRDVIETHPRYEELHRWLASQWRSGEEGRDQAAQAIFADLGLVERPDAWRSALESAAFRALLDEAEPLARAA